PPPAAAPVTQASVWFAGGAVTPMLYQAVRQYPPGGAAPALAALRAGFGTCALDDVDPDGGTLSTRLVPVRAPDVGEEAAAQRISLRWDGMAAEAQAVAFRRGDVMIVLTQMVLG